MTISIYQQFPNQTAQDVFQQSGIDFTKPYDAEQIWYKDPAQTQTRQLSALLNDSSDLVKQNGYTIDPNYWFTEVHSYQAHQQKVSSPFAWHQDDNGGWPEKVVTVLWYLKKDPQLTGGDLLWCDRDPENVFNQMITPYPIINRLAKKVGLVPEDRINRINVKEGTVVVMRGDVWHSPEDVSGVGKRHLVVVQFKQINR